MKERLGLFIVAFAFLVLVQADIPEGSSLQQVAGRVEIIVKPGESKSFTWGLISDSDAESLILLRADGAGSEFISMPKSVNIAPMQRADILVEIAIPSDHPGGVELAPRVYATQEGEPGSQVVINVQMQKTVNIIIEENADPQLRGLALKMFVQDVSVGDSTVAVSIESNSEISGVLLDQERNRLSLNVSGSDGTNGTAVIEVGSVLEGPYQVMLDGTLVTGFELLSSQGGEPDKIRMTYDHSVHTITITGTRVIPEFGVYMLALFAASVMATIVARQRLLKLF
jgi:hypothetical protein